MNLLVPAVVSGLSVGLLYGLLAFSIVALYRATGVVSFAQANLGMVGTFVALLVHRDWGLPGLASIAVAVVIAFGLGLALYVVAIRPNDGAGTLNMVLRTLAISSVLFELATVQWSRGEPFRFPDVVPRTAVHVGDIQIPLLSLVTLGVVSVLGGSLYLLFNRTTVGLLFRAVADGPAVSALLGVRVRAVTAMAWVLAAVLALVVGVLTAPISLVSTNMMAPIVLYAFAAALIGGLNSWQGCFVGGALVGVVGNVTIVYASNEIAVLVVFLLLLATLTLRPDGFFGDRAASRV